MSSLSAKARFARLGGSTGTQAVPSIGTRDDLTIADTTTARVAAVSDDGQLINFTNAAATTYTIKPYATAPLPLGAILYAMQGNTGQVTFVPFAGVTFETPDSYKTRAQESIIGMKHVSLDVWQAFGDLEQVFPALSIPANATNASAKPTFLQAATDAYALIRRGTALVFDALAQSDIVGLVAALAAKAPLASPALTGTPTAPTASPGDNSTKIATTAYVDAAVAAGGGGATIINGVQYVIDTGSTADSDPGAGLLKYNNATQASATFLYLDDLSDDAVTMTALWAGLVAGGFVYIQSATNQDTWQIWDLDSIVDASGYAKFGVTLIADGGAFADGDLVLMTVQQGYSSGAIGDQTSVTFTEGSAPSTPASGKVVVYAKSDGLIYSKDDAGVETLMSGGGSGAGAMVYLGSAAVSGSAATTLTISGLDLNTAKNYHVKITVKNATASTPNMFLYYNSDTTNANYARQGVRTDSTALTAARGADGLVGVTLASAALTLFGRISKDFDGKPISDWVGSAGGLSTLVQRHINHFWNSTSNVTGMTASMDVANSLSVGSKIQIWEVRE